MQIIYILASLDLMIFLVTKRIVVPKYRDVDPNPVGSAFIWVRGSGTEFKMRIRIQWYKIRDKSRVKPTIFSRSNRNNYAIQIIQEIIFSFLM